MIHVEIIDEEIRIYGMKDQDTELMQVILGAEARRLGEGFRFHARGKYWRNTVHNYAEHLVWNAFHDEDLADTFTAEDVTVDHVWEFVIFSLRDWVGPEFSE